MRTGPKKKNRSRERPGNEASKRSKTGGGNEPSRGTFSKVSPDWSKQLKCDMHVTFLSCNLIGQPTLPVKFKHK